MNIWTNIEEVGYLIEIISDRDPRTVREQIESNYAHGGGWNPLSGFSLHLNQGIGCAELCYPGDPPMRERSRTHIRDELVIVFTYDWVAVVQNDGSFAVTRMD
jgi:hypothetical protein